MKKIGTVILLTLCLWLTTSPVLAKPATELVQQQAQELEMTEIESFWEELQRESGEYLPDFTWHNILEWFRPGEGQGLSFSEIINGLWRFMWREIYFNLNLLAKLLFLAVIAALLKNLEKAFANDSISALTQAVVYLALVSIAMQSFAVAIGIGRDSVNNMVELILAVIPLLLALLASLGSFASAALFRPIIIFAVNFFAALTRDVVFPLIFLNTILSIVNYFSPRVTVSKLADLLKNSAVWTMGLCMTIFTGLMSIYGVASTVGDAVSLRTAKFLTSSFLPVVGGMISDAVETVAGATLILKSTVHIAGILVLFYLVAFPLIKILVLVFIYKLAAALIQPLGETSLCDSLNTLGNCLALVFAAVAVVSVIFYFALTVISGAGNASFMLR
ncbi:MAG TPA: stage III sporulation protein AE [Oscillospiraceae bacterium]|nr:stage III sporulation protein AE [Oscillospiraceae bacterium]